MRTKCAQNHTARLLLCRCLCARLSPNLLAPEHLDALLQLVVEEQGNKTDVTFLPAVLSLLVASAAAAPPLFANLGHQVRPIYSSCYYWLLLCNCSFNHGSHSKNLHVSAH